MSNTVFGIVTAFILGMALQASLEICYLSAVAHEENLLLIPEGNPDCIRFLPQISSVHNLKDSVRLLDFKSQ
jgi:hypothetical protein